MTESRVDLENAGMETPNPLHLSVVLTCLGKYLNNKEMKNCRLVCQNWNANFKSQLFDNSNLTVRFVDDYYAKKNVNYILKAFPIPISRKSNDPVFITDFSQSSIPRSLWLQYFKPSKKILDFLKYFGPQFVSVWINWSGPHKKISKWYRISTRSNPYNTPTLVAEMLTLMLPNVKELKITVDVIKNTGSIREELVNGQDGFNNSKAQLNLPNLKKLSFGPNLVNSNEVNPWSLKQLLSSTTTIESLHFNGMFYPNEINLIKYSEICQEAGYFQNLIELKLDCLIELKDIEMLSSIKFKHLRKLTFSYFRGGYRDKEGMKKLFNSFGVLLKSVSHSLQNLQFEVYGSGPIMVQFPCMKELTDLKIWNHEKIQEKGMRIDFVEKLPKLKYFWLHSVYHKPEGIRNANRGPGILELILPPTELADFRHNSLRVVEFKDIPIEDNELRCLAKSFEQLEILTLRYKGYNFTSWLGSLTTLKNLSELILNTQNYICENNWNWGIRKQLPNMKALKRFSFALRTKNWASSYSRFKLLKETVLEGFMKAPKLQYLELAVFTIKPDCEALICNQLIKKLMRIRLIQCYSDLYGENCSDQRFIRRGGRFITISDANYMWEVELRKFSNFHS